jgi:hypothetical protein
MVFSTSFVVTVTFSTASDAVAFVLSILDGVSDKLLAVQM